MNEAQHPLVECQMMIGKPIPEVFQAFVDAKPTTMFWFTKSSRKLEKGKAATWEWEMYGVADQIKVVELLSNEK